MTSVSAVRPRISLAMQDVALEPLEGGDRQSEVTRRLQRAIVVGLLGEGDQLPSESDLSAKLGVSTVTLRVALAELRSQGLIDTRRGRRGGNFIKLPPNWVELQARAQLNEISLEDLRDLRDYSVAVGCGTCRLAAQRIRKSSIADLKAAARALASARTVTERARADLMFHMEIAAATRSAKLTKVEFEIQSSIALFLWIPFPGMQSSQDAVDGHMQLVDAISASDPDLACRVLEQHLLDGLNPLIDAKMRQSRA